MKFFLSALMIFCVFAGLSARVLAMDCCAEEASCEVVESCCVVRHDTSSQPSDHHQGDGCPVEHHHHVCCSHGLTLGAGAQLELRPASAESASLRIRPEGDLPPADLFLGTEKPPLI